MNRVKVNVHIPLKLIWKMEGLFLANLVWLLTGSTPPTTPLGNFRLSILFQGCARAGARSQANLAFNQVSRITGVYLHYTTWKLSTGLFQGCVSSSRPKEM